MRLAAAAALAGALALAAPTAAPAHPGHTLPSVGIGVLAYSPPTLNVVAGDFVAWNWKGPDLDHSVTADAGQAEKFDSDAGKSAAQVNHPAGDQFTYYFAKPGTFTYHCKVHSFMHGSVVVRPAASGPLNTNARPRITRLRGVVGAKRTLRVTFRLSERAGVTLRIRRAHTRRVLRSKFRFAGRGRGSIKVSLRGLRPGHYALSARAADDAGLRSKTASTTFRLKRG